MSQVRISIARMRAGLSNIERYERLLKTRLTETERQYLEMRLLEERSALQTTWPASGTSQVQQGPDRASS